ncbi:MAG: transglycosylase SLT domain-containing protein [Bdellovibrionales bacterium]
MKKSVLIWNILLVFISCLSWASEDELPVMFSDMQKEVETGNGREFRFPDFSNQEKSLGYHVGAFSIPAGMEEKVSFWIDIYSRFNTDQGLLHDSRYVHLVYESLDFTDIMKDDSLTSYQKQRAREKRVNEAKKQIRERLGRLSRLESSAGLEGEDLRYWVMFSQVDEDDKFIKAKHRNRLRFQLGLRDRFQRAIFYSGRYLEEMENIFREYGLPIELTRLPFVESSFNLKARSNVGASGIWQFMRGSARPYLKMNVSVDERNDPIKSTHAAAKLLKHYYGLLESWPLAVTGYNHGAYGMRRMVRKFNTDNLVELMVQRKGNFGFASANFYASFLAALEVEKNAKVLLGEVRWDQPFRYKEISLDKNVTVTNLLSWFGGDKEKAKFYNPHLQSRVWRDQVAIQKQNFIRVPEEQLKVAQEDIYKMPSAQLYKGRTYKIQRGDTLSEIAENFGVQLNQLMSANSNINPRRLRPGQQLFIPVQ